MFPALFCLLLTGDPVASTAWTAESGSRSISHCKLLSLDAKSRLRFRTDSGQQDLVNIVELRRVSALLPPLLTRNFVCLNNGDRIPLDEEAPAILDNSQLKVWPAKSLPDWNNKGIRLYVPNLVMAFWSVPVGVENAERFFTDIESTLRKRDIVYLQNGDRLEGTLGTLTGKDGCIINVGNRKVHTPWSKLAGIAWNTDRQSRLTAKNAYWRGVLDNGARMNLVEATFDEKSRRWTGRTQFGSTFEVAETTLLALDRRMGDAIHLADLTPTHYESRPYLNLAWPLMKNASVRGEPIAIGGSTYERGIGLHAACRVEYKLDGQFQRFVALVGIYESARRGRAKISIEIDGKRVALNEGNELTNQSPPIPIHLDVAGARTLTLIVDQGSFGDVQAQVDFANARLIKKQ